MKTRTGFAVTAAAFAVLTLLGVGIGRTGPDVLEAGDVKPAIALSRPAGTPAPEPFPGPGVERTSPAKPRSDRPVGTWVRDFGPVGRITLKFTEDRLYGSMEVTEDAHRITLGFDADFSVNRENVLYGVITGVDVPVGTLAQSGGDADSLIAANAYADLPFCFRFRVDGDSLMIKGLKFLDFIGVDSDDSDIGGQVALIMGKYKRQEEK